ncbi:MAG TPA: hypothetical protein PKN33_08805 [Phycisphaerae bacterium]|nr:hypothetical protein [Phycisphaerae bacterium]
MNDADRQHRLDRATSTRLAKLARRPVNTLQLEEWVEQALREKTIQKPSPSTLIWKKWLRPITTAAAVIVVATIGWFAPIGDTLPAMAAPAGLASIHFDVANGLAPHLKASNVHEANRLLAEQSSSALTVPELPGEIRSCCLHQYAATTLTCVLIEQDGELITVAIADLASLRSPKGKSITRGDRVFMVHTVNGINMVMAHEGKRWLCVMGELPIEELVEVAEDIRM